MEEPLEEPEPEAGAEAAGAEQRKPDERYVTTRLSQCTASFMIALC